MSTPQAVHVPSRAQMAAFARGARGARAGVILHYTGGAWHVVPRPDRRPRRLMSRQRLPG